MINTRHHIEYNEEKCVGCQICYKACFVDVIRWDEQKKRPIFRYVEDCEHCLLCMALCKKEAIRIIPDFTSEHLLQSFEKYR